jgi:uncharacterized protein
MDHLKALDAYVHLSKRIGTCFSRDNIGVWFSFLGDDIGFWSFEFRILTKDHTTFTNMEIYDEIITKYYPPDSLRYQYYYTHSQVVTELALKIARNNPKYKPNLDYIKTAGMLHDIGIFLTDAPQIGCFGDKPYICHGYLGRELLEKEGLPDIAPVCERHIGVGLTADEIVKRGLPLPVREMLPVTIEEKIITYADKFYSKSAEDLTKPKPIEKIINKLAKHGEDKVFMFNEFIEMFGKVD